MASTLVMKPAGACGEWSASPESTFQKIVANDENYALAA